MRAMFCSLVWIAILPGCTTGNSSGSDMRGADLLSDQNLALTETKACADYATAYCAKEVMCTGGTAIPRVYGDNNTCMIRAELDCKNRLGEPDTTNTVQIFENCGPAITAQACTDFFTGLSPTACGSPMAGTRSNGATCIGGAQCSIGNCLYSTGSVCGICEPRPNIGDSCDPVACAGTQYCQQEAGGKDTCQVLSQQGQPCSYADRTRACAPGLGCQGAKSSADGVCQPAPNTVGAACDPSAMTTPPCDPRQGLFCDSGTQKCVAVTYASPAEACDNGKTQCNASGFCQISAGASMGTCQAHAADGAACDTRGTPGCLFPARCATNGSGTAGVCRFADASNCP